MAAGNLRYVIDVDDNGTASIRKFDQTAGESLDRTAKKTAGLGDAFLKVGRIALTAAGLIAGALGGIGLAKAVGEAVSFNKAFAGVVSLFGDGQRATAAFGRDLGSVQGELSDMSGRLGTTTELARVLYQTISSGVPAAKAMETVRAAAELAAAGMADAEESSKLLTTVLNAFPGVARGAAGASDLLFRTTKQGKVEISDLNASFGNLLPVGSPGTELEFAL